MRIYIPTGICHIIIIHIILTCWQAATSSISREQQPLSMIEHHEWRNWRDGRYSCILQFQILLLVWLDVMSRLGFILATVLVLIVSSKFSTAFLPPRPTASLFLSSTCLASGLGDKHGNVDPSKDHPNGNNTTTRDFKISPGDMVSVKRKKGSKFKEEIADNRDNLPFVVKLTTPDPYLCILFSFCLQKDQHSRPTRKHPN